jgi:CRISPR-associated endonuclease/helicase Cas3
VNRLQFDAFFRSATVNSPYDYQCRLACGDDARLEKPEMLIAGCDCRSLLINIPTGLGKTAAVVLAWLWNRVQLQNPKWPRRLVYCLPMRTLVEQTGDEVGKWLKNLLMKATDLGINGQALKDLQWLAKHSPIILMGGEELDDSKRDWDIHPERPAILIGTQDMLLSRALNRGYGMSRYRWAMHFGLLNNDCMWVLDEMQLMGAGLATACQLEAIRLQDGPDSAARFNSYPGGRSVTWYASATANPSHLQTRDWRGIERPKPFFFELLEAEKLAATGPVAERRLATKHVEIQKGWNFGDKQKAPTPDLIEDVVHRHQAMLVAMKDSPAKLPRRTLIICNTVDRAVAVHQALQTELTGQENIDLMLMHSRFRPKERKKQTARLGNPDLNEHPAEQIIVATQVIEAGVDLSSAILWTEIAPLACLVQRFGRLNRSGEFGFNKQALHGFAPLAIVVGIEAPDPESKDFKNKDQKDKAGKEAEQKHLPYAKEKCDNAWTTLAGLNGDASPAALAEIKEAVSASIDRCPYSLQQHELLDFFDTDANLSLGFTDVSPFVRGIDPETDFYVAWRDWPGSDDGERPNFSADFQRQELCPVSIGKLRDARALLSKGWVWRGKEAGWRSIQSLDVVPGMTILLPVMAGGYCTDAGWTGREQDKPVESVYELGDTPSDEEMLSSLDNGWQSIAQHTDEVTQEWERIVGALEELHLSSEEQSSVLAATRWHDIGKNHRAWQAAAEKALTDAGIPPSKAARPIAKFSLSESPRLQGLIGDALKKELRGLRQSFTPGLAHEVASALAFRQSEQAAHGTQRPIESLLAEYLIMSHHGRVRKVLRDEIPRHPKNEKDTETVRGIANGNPLPSVTIAGQELQCASLSTDCRRMGRDADGNESYTRGVLRLLAHYGPFRLAFFEVLFRAADIRASIRAGKSTPNPQP